MENHPASFKGCKIRIELNKKLKPGPRAPNYTINRDIEIRHVQYASTSAVRNGVFYADMTRTKAENNYSVPARNTITLSTGEQYNSNRNLATPEKAILDIKARLDQLFKLVIEKAKLSFKANGRDFFGAPILILCYDLFYDCTYKVCFRIWLT